MPDARRLLVASIHDVSPRFESAIDRLMNELEPWVSTRLSMLVVPNHWGDCPIRSGSPFAARLRRWADSGVEMILHGFYHRDDARHCGFDRFRSRHFTAGEGEFLALSRGEASQRLTDGRALLEAVTGRPVNAFVAPAWLYGDASKAALAETGFAIAEDHLRIWSPATGRTVARGPVITWASRTPWRAKSSIAAAAVLRRLAPQHVLRVAVHPGDCSLPALLHSIRATFAFSASNRRAARYSELIDAAP